MSGIGWVLAVWCVFAVAVFGWAVSIAEQLYGD